MEIQSKTVDKYEKEILEQFPRIKAMLEADEIIVKKYNIENIEQMTSDEGNIILSSKAFVRCILCDEFFLNIKAKIKQGRNVCPGCSEIVRHLADKL
jgi:formylmethanofuran dehydrogenase subunit E